MSQLTLTIGGKAHRVSCADGEEAHITQLGAMVDDKLKAMGGNLSAQDAENLLFAALLLADELHDIRQKAPAAREPDQPRSSDNAQHNVAPKLSQLAEMLENCADKLESVSPAS
jgi:cell division protein ZapA